MSNALTPEAVFDLALEARGEDGDGRSVRVADVATFTIRRRDR